MTKKKLNNEIFDNNLYEKDPVLLFNDAKNIAFVQDPAAADVIVGPKHCTVVNMVIVQCVIKFDHCEK